MFLKTRMQKLIQNKFAQNVAIIASGTAGAQAIAILLSPVITRLYGPEAFGLLGIFTSLTIILSTIISLCYPIAIVLPKEDDEAKGLAWLSFYIALSISFLLLIALFLWADGLLDLVGAQEIAPFALFIPLFLIFSATTQIAQQWLIRKKMFYIYAKSAVYQAVLVGCAKIGLGIINPAAAILIIVYSFGQLFVTFSLLLNIQKQESSANHSYHPKPSTNQLTHLAQRYSDFPLYRSPQVFINAISQNLPVLLLASLFGPLFAGFYTLAKSVLAQPTNLISHSLGNVFYPHASEAFRRNKNLTPLLIKATAYLALVGIIPYGLIIGIGPQAFEFVFGIEWRSAGEYARWLSLMLFFGFINRPSVMIVPIIGEQKLLLIYEIASTGIKILALYLGFAIFKSDKIAVALFSGFGTITYIILIAGVILKTKRVANARKTD